MFNEKRKREMDTSVSEKSIDHNIPAPSHIILYDGVCNLCNGMVRFIIKKDKKALFRFAAIQSQTGQSLITQYANDDEEKTVSIYYIRNQECYRKSAAILYILKDLGKGWKLLFPLIHIPAILRDSLYLFISRNRYKLFGREQTCMIPTPEIKNRFI